MAPVTPSGSGPTARRSPLLLGVVLGVVLALLLGGCGSGAVVAPGQPDGPPASTSGQPGTGTTGRTGSTGGASGTPATSPGGGEAADGSDEDLFSFGLPEGPSTVADTVVDDVYIPIAENRCADAQRSLDELWPGFNSPRTVLLYQAGVSMCSGEESGARAWLARADALGWAGVGLEYFVVNDAGESTGTFRYDCELYRSLRHALDQVPRESVECPGGDPPPWLEPDVDPRASGTGTGDGDGTTGTSAPGDR